MADEIFTKKQLEQLDKFFIANSLDLRSGSFSRQTISGTYEDADSLHSIYADFGYPLTLNFSHFWNMYRRFGIAKAVVELNPISCWSTPPNIKANSRVLEGLDFLVRKRKLWKKLESVDKRQRVGQYAALFMRVRDNKTPENPIESKLSGLASLDAIIPLYEGQITPKDFDRNPASSTYGMPTMYQYNGSGSGDRNPDMSDSFDIHPDRLIIISENADDDSIYGFSSMESCFNSLMDLRKIIGAGGEGFYRNASQNLAFETKESSQVIMDQTSLDEFDLNVQKFIKDRMRKHLYAPGMEVRPISSTLIQPKEFFNIALNDVAASTGIPATILVGQQTGRLASDEDQSHFNFMNQSRRENFLTSVVENVINWLMKYGILAASDFEIEWDDLLSAGDEQKLNLAEKMASINEKQFRSGGAIPFSDEEIRKAAGYLVEEFDEADETLEDEDNEEFE